jgi:hypothetical protein
MDTNNKSFMNAALFIKRAEESQTKEFIMKAFKKSNIGIVKEVTFIQKNSKGVAYNGVVVIFERWNMNKYVETLFNKMSESPDGTTRFYFEPKRYWIINVHKQQLPECEESIIVDSELSDKERIKQMEATIKSMSAQIYYMQTNNEKNERRMMDYEQKDIQKHLINTELQCQLEIKDMEKIWREKEYQEQIQQLKNENLCLRASVSLLESDVAKHLKQERLFKQEITDLNIVIDYLENQAREPVHNISIEQYDNPIEDITQIFTKLQIQTNLNLE